MTDDVEIPTETKPIVDLTRLQAMSDEELANELDAMVDAAIEKKVRGPKEMVAICALVPLLTQQLRQSAYFIDLPRLD